VPRPGCGTAAAIRFSPLLPDRLPALDHVGKVILRTPGLTHFYPLDSTFGPDDAVGHLNGVNHCVTFTEDGAVFDGRSHISIPDNDDFSVTTTGHLSVIAFLTIDDWRGSRPHSTQYVHWLGKGKRSWHEWVFRHYVRGASGEAAQRQGRTSFYYFNPEGGLGSGSYFQDLQLTSQRFIVGTVNMRRIAIWKNGVKQDEDPLSGFQVTPENTPSDVRIGSLGDESGSLIGRIRNLAFFDRELTPAQVDAIYNATVN